MMRKRQRMRANIRAGTNAWNALRLQEAVDLFEKAEKTDETIELKVKIANLMH